MIWPLVGYKKWHKDARDGKQAEAHGPENPSRDVGRDECGTGREGSSMAEASSTIAKRAEIVSWETGLETT